MNVPRECKLRSWGGAMEGCVCVHVTKLMEYSLQNFKMYVKMYWAVYNWNKHILYFKLPVQSTVYKPA